MLPDLNQGETGRENRTNWLVLSGILIAVATGAAHYYVSRSVPLIHDALGYYRIANQIWSNGLFTNYELSDLRTYGYPAALGGMLRLAALTHFPERTIVFVVQLAAHIGACFFLRYAFRIAGVRLWVRETVFSITLCNPLVLVYPSYMLTESLSFSCTIALFASAAIACARPRFTEGPLIAGGLFLGYLIALRPANIYLIPMWGIALLATFWRRPAISFFYASSLSFIPVLIPLVPQICNNLLYHHTFTPLVARSFAKEQEYAGILWSKTVTFLDPGHQAGVVYLNPLYHGEPLSQTDPLGWYIHHPGRGIGTIALHTFGLFDQDFPHPYNFTLTPGYYPLVSDLNLWIVALGWIAIVFLLFRWRRLGRPEQYIAILAFLTVGAHLSVHSLSSVECRYGVPALMFVWAAAGLLMVYLYRQGSARERILVIVVSVLLAIAGSRLSSRIRWQAPQIRAAIESQDPKRQREVQQLLASSTKDRPLSFGSLTSWHYENALVGSDGQGILVSPDEVKPSIIQHPITLEKSQNYEISFEAKAISPAVAGLSVDFYGPNYDLPEQNAIFYTFKDRYERFVIRWNSGETAPPSAFLRFVTLSSLPIEIRNVSIVKR